MPPTVEVTYAPQYTDENIGLGAKTAAGAVADLLPQKVIQKVKK